MFRMLLDSWRISLACAVLATTIHSCSAFDQVPLRRQSKFQTRPSSITMGDISHGHLSHLELEFGTPESILRSHVLMRSLLGSPESVSRDGIREISVSGWQYPEEDTQLVHLFEGLTNLETVHWTANRAIPPSILRSLEVNSPTCSVHYTLGFQYSADRRSRGPDTDSVLNSTILYALKAEIHYGGEANWSDLSLIFDILTSCPNLRELELNIQHYGCVVSRAVYAFDFSSNPSVKFPPLEVLKLDGYRLDEESDGGFDWYFKDYLKPDFNWTAWYEEEIDLPPLPVRNVSDGRNNLDCWLQAMDWSHLHTLELSPSVLTLKKLEDAVLPRLKRVAFSGTGDEFDNAIQEFLKQTVQPLESISLWGLQPSDTLVEAIVGRHADKLANLTLGSQSGILPVSKGQLEILIKQCTKLRIANVNLPRPKTRDVRWDLDTLLSLTSLPDLEHLILRFPSPDHKMYKRKYAFTDTLNPENVWINYKKFGSEGDIPDPHVNTSTLEELFTELRLSSKQKGREKIALRKLEVYVGEWETRHDLPTTNWVRVGHWECNANENGVEKCVGGQTRNDV